MKLRTRLTVAFLFVGFLFTQNAMAQDKAVGELTFETEVMDYGTVHQGDDGLTAFKFTNTGNAPVVISKVKTTCGCTVASKPEGPIQPGETAQIEVNYSTKKVGKFAKSITVISNAKNPNMTLKIKGDVVKKPSK